MLNIAKPSEGLSSKPCLITSFFLSRRRHGISISKHMSGIHAGKCPGIVEMDVLELQMRLNNRLHSHTQIYIYVYISFYIYIYMCISQLQFFFVHPRSLGITFRRAFLAALPYMLVWLITAQPR